jgi:hypothetical protein
MADDTPDDELPDGAADDLPVVPLDDDDVVSPEDDVAQAADSALAASAAAPSLAAVTPVAADGMGWQFDWEARRFVRNGGRPAEVRGEDALAQRVMLAIHTTRFRYALIPNEFGFDRMDDIPGTVANEEALSDFERRLRECVAAVPGCSDIAEFAAHVDSREGVFSIDSFVVITESGGVVSLGPVSVSLGV